ncbi:MAG: hypothetical protein ABIP54_01110 [Candidatus Andersenbacteria bacterium]
MTVRLFGIGTIATFLFSTGILALIISWVDPTSNGSALAMVLFFLTMFLSVGALFALLGYAARRLIIRHQLSSYSVRPALRQGLFFGIFVDILLFLQLERILVWWVAGIIILLFVVIELVFISYDSNGTTTRGPRTEGNA